MSLPPTSPDDASHQSDPADEPVAPGGVAVVTVVQGGDAGLPLLHRSLSVGDVPPDLLVVVEVRDNRLLAWSPERGVDVRVVALSGDPHAPSWADSRNAGGTVALQEDADVIVFLDARSVVSGRTVGALARAVRQHPDVVTFGTATRLPPPPEAGYDLDTVLGGSDDDEASEAPPGVEPAVLALSRSVWARLRGFHDEVVGAGDVAGLTRTLSESGVGAQHTASARVWLQHTDRDATAPADDLINS